MKIRNIVLASVMASAAQWERRIIGQRVAGSEIRAFHLQGLRQPHRRKT